MSVRREEEEKCELPRSPPVGGGLRISFLQLQPVLSVKWKSPVSTLWALTLHCSVMEIAAVGGKVNSTCCVYNVVSLQLSAAQSSKRRKNGREARGRRAESYKGT